MQYLAALAALTLLTGCASVPPPAASFTQCTTDMECMMTPECLADPTCDGGPVPAQPQT